VAIQHGVRKIEVTDMRVPDQLGPDEALVRVEGCGICGTDYEQYSGAFANDDSGLAYYPYPMIPGHEPVGRIEWLGASAAERWRCEVGDRVAIEAHAGCSACRYCTSGEIPLCPNKLIYGYGPLSLGCGLWGGFSDHMVLKGNTILHRLPEHISVEDAVLFNPLGAGFEWVVNTGGTGVGDDVLILGPGQRGLSGVIAAVAAGANRIVVTGLEQDKHKLKIAEALGATETVVVDPKNPESLQHLASQRLFDRVIDVTPYATQPINDAIQLVRPGGTITLGGFKGQKMEIHPDHIIRKGIRIRGAKGVVSNSYALAVRAVASGQFDFSSWHTHTMKVKDVELAIQVLGGEVKKGPDPIHITVVP
jgi:2-desacetyl-2-hydroxyethyl bacteriochlorophyllide A dehydrogenase